MSTKHFQFRGPAKYTSIVFLGWKYTICKPWNVVQMKCKKILGITLVIDGCVCKNFSALLVGVSEFPVKYSPKKSRVARWYIFIPKFPNWVYFEDL
jgi:hypothetical protein